MKIRDDGACLVVCCRLSGHRRRVVTPMPTSVSHRRPEAPEEHSNLQDPTAHLHLTQEILLPWPTCCPVATYCTVVVAAALRDYPAARDITLQSRNNILVYTLCQPYNVSTPLQLGWACAFGVRTGTNRHLALP